jgi:hypothetical protein
MAKKNEINIIPLFANPLLQIQLDLDTDKLTELAVQMQNKDKKGRADGINKGGWQSNNIAEEPHEEVKKLKKEIFILFMLFSSKCDPLTVVISIFRN